VATAVPGYLGRKLGLTTDFKHWNWITDKLILGALPVKSQVGTSGDHLSKLRAQLDEFHQKIGLIVSCVQPEEFEGYGISALQFVKPNDWTEALGVTDFCLIPMLDFGTGVSFDQLVEATDRMSNVIHNQGQCVYVHCKAGKGRSWVVTMCYLIAQEGMTFAAAEDLVKSRRHQVSPSESQVAKVKEFEELIGKQRRALSLLRREASLKPLTHEDFEKLRNKVQSLPIDQRKIVQKHLEELDFDLCDQK